MEGDFRMKRNVFKFADLYIDVDQIVAIQDLVIPPGAVVCWIVVIFGNGTERSMFCHMTDADYDEVSERSAGLSAEEHNEIMNEVQNRRTRETHSALMRAWRGSDK